MQTRHRISRSLSCSHSVHHVVCIVLGYHICILESSGGDCVLRPHCALCERCERWFTTAVCVFRPHYKDIHSTADTIEGVTPARAWPQGGAPRHHCLSEVSGPDRGLLVALERQRRKLPQNHPHIRNQGTFMHQDCCLFLYLCSAH